MNAIEYIQSETPFAFTRWGDGEWNAVLQRRPGKANCDGHAYFPDMGAELGKIIRRPPEYMIGMQPLARRLMGAQIDAFLGKELPWVSAEIFHKSAQRGEWGFLDAFKGQRHAIVGPEHLRRLFPKSRFFAVPDKDCWLATEDVLSWVRKKLTEKTCVGFCASMAANVWIDRLWQEQPGKHLLVDFGSVFDPLVGVRSRTYMQPVTLAVMAWPLNEARLRYLSMCLESLEGLTGAALDRHLFCETEGVSDDARAHVEQMASDRGYAVHWHEGNANIGLHLDSMYGAMSRDKIIFYVQEDFILEPPLSLASGMERLGEYDQIQYAMIGKLPKDAQRGAIIPLPSDNLNRFSHRPHLGKADTWHRLGPFGPGKSERGRGQEAQMNDKWIQNRMRTGVHVGGSFKHVGKESLVRDGKVWEL